MHPAACQEVTYQGFYLSAYYRSQAKAISKKIPKTNQINLVENLTSIIYLSFEILLRHQKA